MLSVKDNVAARPDISLERFLGQTAQILEREALTISHSIKVEYLQIGFTETRMPEEHGRLFLFPVDDGQYNVQLLYLQHNETPADTGTVCWLHFFPSFFEQYPPETLVTHVPFRFDHTTEQQFSICLQTREMLSQLRDVQSITGFLQSLHQSEIALHLLRRALEKILVPFDACPVPACRFLAYDSERDKIFEARRLLDVHLDRTITIKELSRKVAMNECYLKKGFKALTGKTIHEYQQERRITKARELLSQPGYSVSEVAAQLGFSSISHFSTAFKRATGLKPCELLK